MRTIDSFYNPDEQQAFQYHQKLLKVAEQERLAHQVIPANNSHSPSLARGSIFKLEIANGKTG